MTRNEVKKILMTVQASYPNWHPQDLTFTLNAWQVMLCDYEYRDIDQALKLFILSDDKGFAPAIGQIVDKIRTIRESTGEIKVLGDLEAWNLVFKAIGRSIYGSEEEFNKLPEQVQKAVGSPANLKEWAQMDINTVQSVEQSHFLRAYRSVCERSKSDSLIQKDILGLAEKRIAELEQKGDLIE